MADSRTLGSNFMLIIVAFKSVNQIFNRLSQLLMEFSVNAQLNPLIFSK